MPTPNIVCATREGLGYSLVLGLGERPEIAGAAHALLARILWESQSLDAEKLQEIEEHRQKAEALLPETAEAYFLRAMTALTVKEQLAALDKALQLDPGHYESRRLRAFTYYASRKYDRLQADALGMTILRPRDPLGYSLRAVAWRELGRYKDAIADYDGALALTPKDGPAYVDLSTQRSETLLRMGDYERVIAEAQIETQDSASVAGILPAIRGRDALDTQNLASLRQYHVFCALTVLGDYEKATALFQQIISPGLEARTQFQNWCAKYVFDTLAAGRFWHPAGPVPAEAAFLPMVEAEETYRILAAKGRRLTTDGFAAAWSPDGKKLAFSLGVQGRSGIAVFDPATKETELLIVPGKYPKWSPDGRYIAFVRDRQFLPVPEFVAANPKNEPPASADEEVWLMKSDGTEPRRLARGVWPSWDRDSARVYYKSRSDNTLYSISITGEESEPKRIAPCPEWNPSVSPDNQRMASIDRTFLKVKDLSSQTMVAEWPLPSPSDGWSASAWSPDGNELCLGGSGGLENTTGLWIYRLGQSKPAQVLSGPITVGSWAANGTKLVFELGSPYFQIWTADLNAKAPTTVALGPSRTPEEHFREMIALCTHRIETDPRDAYAYSNRARYYDCLHDREKARADMRQWSAALGGGLPLDPPVGAPRRFRGAINGPFGYQLAFSVGGRDNGIPVLCVAFGQKGRCEMKLFEIPMVVTSLVGLGFLAGLDVPAAHADFTFGEPVNIQSDFPFLDPATEWISCFSADGLEVYGVSCRNRPGAYGLGDLWVCKRASPEDDWSLPENLGAIINSASHDGSPFLTADGLELYFWSGRGGGYGAQDLYVTRRATRTSPWGVPTNLGQPVNTSQQESGPVVSPDGLELYFISTRPGGYGGFDMYVSTRATPDDPWGDPVNLGPAVNSPGNDGGAGPLSPDGLLMFVGSDRPGGFGPWGDGYVTRRASRSAPWQPAVNLGPIVNATVYNCPLMSADGSNLYIIWDPNDDMTNWTYKAPILPIVDFNGDGKVDLVDLVMLIDNWGTNKTLCDIGPMPWGDGKVDIEDLKVFMTHWEKENPAKSKDDKGL
jgi:Tol biopolymer transport system component/tetratricopeptide (TPR) repeat protein